MHDKTEKLNHVSGDAVCLQNSIKIHPQTKSRSESLQNSKRLCLAVRAARTKRSLSPGPGHANTNWIEKPISISLKILPTLAQAEITVEAETTLRKSLRSSRSCKAMGHSLPSSFRFAVVLCGCWKVACKCRISDLERLLRLDYFNLEQCTTLPFMWTCSIFGSKLPASHAATKLP